MAGFLVYMTPAAFIVTWELAKYFFGDKLMIKVLESISISFYALAFISVSYTHLTLPTIA